MTLQQLYEIGLESPDQWFLIFGASTQGARGGPQAVNVDMFYAFILGLVRVEDATGSGVSEYGEFVAWLRDTQGEFPGGGWRRKYLAEANGDHVAAIERFLKRVHQYVLETKPAWLLAINAHPLPSRLQNAQGTPLRADVRNPNHMALLVPASGGPKAHGSG